MSKKVIDNLKIVLAESYSLALKTQSYHWNVTGPNFQSLHSLFEVQYTDIATAIDEIAERIRALGDKAPATFKAYSKLSTIKDGNENFSAKEMVNDLIKDQKTIVKTLKKLADSADSVDDEVTEGLAVDRMKIHEKNIWLLQSSL
jgi:starvation-inducible DNA-binding protein